MPKAQTLEDALAAVEADAAAALKRAATVVRELKRARSAAAAGTVRDLQRALQAAHDLAVALAAATDAALEDWQFDVEDYLASGGYTAELLRVAAGDELAVIEEDGRILSYPSVLRLLPGDAAIEIDKKRERRLRPSVLVRALRHNQQRPARFKPEQFLESLARAYDFVVKGRGARPGATIRLTDVYAVLTLLPGQQRDYSVQEFARDLYLLDQSGVERTKDDRTFALPASTLTKGGKRLVTVTATGQRKIYAGITFS